MGLQLPLCALVLIVTVENPASLRPGGCMFSMLAWFYDFGRADCLYPVSVLLFLHASEDVEGGFFRTIAPW